MRLIVLLTILLLTSCKATQNLSVFSFDNEDIESMLIRELPQLSTNLRVMGLPVEFEVNEIDVNIGPNNTDVVALSLSSTAKIKALILSYPVTLNLQVEGSPFYDSQEKAIFLRNVNLLDSNIDAGGFKGNLNVLNKETMLLINSFLKDNPIYRIDESDPKMRLFINLGLDIKVYEGKISIVPGG